MNLTFRIRFHTEYGQSLWLTGAHELLGGGQPEKAVALRYVDATCWETTLDFPPSTAPGAPLTYSYLLREKDGFVLQDWCANRVIDPAVFEGQQALLVDTWNDASLCENAFYTEPFRRILLRANHTELVNEAPPQFTHLFKVRAPLLAKGQTLCLLGRCPSLGQWRTDAPVLLNRTEAQDFLTVRLDLARERLPVEYKYGVFDVERGIFVRYEEGDNRFLQKEAAADALVCVEDGFVRLPANTWKGAGLAIPVFSLRSAESFGVGEFADLKLLADWCQDVGLKLIQVLPVNDTTATYSAGDSYPYSAISAFALHPIYLRLSAVADPSQRALLEKLEPERKRLNSLPGLDYAAVMAAKLGSLRQLFALQKTQTFATADFQAFFEQNKTWLIPYAAFSCLRDRYGTPNFGEWPDCRKFDAEVLAKVRGAGAAGRKPQPPAGSAPRVQPGPAPAAPGPGADGEPPRVAPGAGFDDELGFHFFLQYHLHLQLREAAHYAHSQGVILKGDIAIGVSPCGADAWQNPQLYRLDMQAGAPPDAFAAKGQNWGFPTYNWEQMQADGFAWWKQRFGQMGRYFDAFRIDHILGFFRIWSIPRHAIEGLLGYFVRALPVGLDEFAARGIPFDHDRFVKPFITDAVLLEVFGDEAELAKSRFLQAAGAGTYVLKPEFATQQQVAAHFGLLAEGEKGTRLQTGLYDLICNVLLIEMAGSGGQQFHFRFGIESTSSFKNLPPATQGALRDLYLDYFFRRQDAFWMREGMEKLPALKRVTNMLVCGEDLGMVPDCVPVAMKRLGLLSLEVQRMPKDWRHQFSRPAQAPYLSVVTPSTHDMSTLRGWWEEDRQLTQTFFTEELGQPGAAPYFCEPWVNQAIVEQHLASPAMWSVFQMQDLLGMDGVLRRQNPNEERINVPADPHHLWNYRLHLTLEQLLQATEFNEGLRTFIETNGR